MHVERIAPWAPGYDDVPARDRQTITHVIVHRIEVSQEDSTFGDTPAEVIRFFAEHAIGRAATGGKMPYPIIIEASGQITQAVPLACITPHAAGRNPSSIGVACIGDFRHHALPAAQWAALVQVCAWLTAELHFPVQDIASGDRLSGHDEMEGASRVADKVCPGDHLPMSKLRIAVADAIGGEISPLALLW